MEGGRGLGSERRTCGRFYTAVPGSAPDVPLAPPQTPCHKHHRRQCTAGASHQKAVVQEPPNHTAQRHSSAPHQLTNASKQRRHRGTLPMSPFHVTRTHATHHDLPIKCRQGQDRRSKKNDARTVGSVRKWGALVDGVLLSSTHMGKHE